LFDEAAGALLDRFSGKVLTIDFAGLRALHPRATAEGEPYLLLLFEDGRQLALARAGVAFPPDTRNAGPLPGLPQVVCWRDFAAVEDRIRHVLEAHPDEPVGREVLDMIRFCIALLDGARAVGFDVGEEERRLERSLSEVERRKEA
jgi:hypothetical protein